MLNQLKDVFSSLEKRNVRYVVIGGIAAVLHGVPRATFDLDLLIEASEKNVEALLQALLDARFGTAALTSAQEVLANEITIFRDRVRLDIQTRTPGLVFTDGWRDRVTMDFQGQKFFVVSKPHLIASKKAAGRKVDLEDVRLLEPSGDA